MRASDIRTIPQVIADAKRFMGESVEGRIVTPDLAKRLRRGLPVPVLTPEWKLAEFLARPWPCLPISATQANQERAAGFVLRTWQEYKAGLGERRPTNLARACRLSSLVAVKLFGGDVRGNVGHQWAELAGQIIDLTENVDYGEYNHAGGWWLSQEHLDGLVTWLDLATGCVEEFLARTE